MYFHTPKAILIDLRNFINKILLFFGLTYKNENIPFSNIDREKLESAPRYTKMEIRFFDTPFYVSDPMTFLSGYKEIFKKEPYLFEFDENTPWIIDCGANVGLSVVYFKKKYPSAKIIAVEPDPELFKLLKRNIESFGWYDVILIQKGVWFEDGIIRFRQEGGFSGQISKSEYSDELIEIESISLETLIGNLEIGLLKIDIEGAENDIFLNSAPNFEKVSNIFMEYHSRKNEQQNLQRVLTLLSEQGFRYHIHHEFINQSPFLNRFDLVGMDLQLSVFGYKKYSFS
jgi:FkbM family methyltransferase